MVKEKLIELFDLAKTRDISINENFDFKIHLAIPENSDYQILYTSGLSKHAQNVDDKFQDFRHIELYMCLPDYWNLDKNDWPINWLNRIAESPIKNNTWFGPGDTISTRGEKIITKMGIDNPNSTVNTFQYFILSEPIYVDELNINEDYKFLSVFPIHDLEFEYKMRNSSIVLLKKLQQKGHSEKIDIYRKSVCRKRVLGLL